VIVTTWLRFPGRHAKKSSGRGHGRARSLEELERHNPDWAVPDLTHLPVPQFMAEV